MATGMDLQLNMQIPQPQAARPEPAQPAPPVNPPNPAQRDEVAEEFQPKECKT